jgi:hypothetical protein
MISYYYVWLPTTSKLYFLIILWWYDFLMCEQFCSQVMIIIPVSISECMIVFVQCHSWPIWPVSVYVHMYFASTLATVFSEPDMCIQTPVIRSSKSHVHFSLLKSFQRIHLTLRPCVTFHKILIFYGEVLLVPRQHSTGGPPHDGCPQLLSQYNLMKMLLEKPMYYSFTIKVETSNTTQRLWKFRKFWFSWF